MVCGVADWEFLFCGIAAKVSMRNLLPCNHMAMGGVQAVAVFQHTMQAWVVNPHGRPGRL